VFQDYLFFGTDIETKYVFRMCHLSSLAQTARANHQLSAGRSTILADVLVGGVLLSSLLEEEERINLRIQMGSEYTVATETTLFAETKGYIEFDEESPLLEGIEAGGRIYGEMTVRSLRSKRGAAGMFEGITRVHGSSAQEALSDHLRSSYQLPADIRLQSWVDERDGTLRAFGVIFMELPGLDKKIAERLWSHVAQLPSIRELYQSSDDPDVLGRKLIPDDLRAIKSIKPTWSCSCSMDSIEAMILRLQESDRAELLEKAEPLDIRCHYCSKHYEVPFERLQILIRGRQ
jgi:molecular chaperone Hsp33